VKAVDTSHGGGVAESNLVRPNADNWTVLFKEGLNSATLLHTDNVRDDPKIRGGSIPWAWDDRQRRKKETVKNENYGVADRERYREEKGLGDTEGSGNRKEIHRGLSVEVRRGYVGESKLWYREPRSVVDAVR
jgi:hypothetical protein